MSIYACSDLHGQGKLWEKIKEFLKPTDTLYFIGDAIDRGKDGWTIADDLLNMDNVVYIRGNHEQMAIDTFWNMDIHPDAWELCRSHRDWIRSNGAQKWCPDKIWYNKEKREYYKKKFESLPIQETIEVNGKEIILDHSGYAVGMCTNYSHVPMWDRDHFNWGWNEDKEYDNVYLVHGHTPTYFFDIKLKHFYSEYPLYASDYVGQDVENEIGYVPKVMRYAKGHKFNIDMGAFFTGRTVLLNLDTFKEVYFDVPITNNNDERS